MRGKTVISHQDIVRIVTHHARALGIGNISSVTSRHLGTGENNLNLLVRINHRLKVVLRICLRKERQKRMHEEYTMMRLLPSGVGARLLVFDESRRFIPFPFFILTYISGRHRFHWSNRELHAFALLLARLHHVRKPLGIKAHYDIVTSSEKHLKGFGTLIQDRRIKRFLPAMRAYIRSKCKTFSGLRFAALIHGDACINNIVWSRNQPALIDWENSLMHDPAQDLARIYYPHKGFYPWTLALTDRQVDAFIKEYMQCTPPDPTLKERVLFWNTYDLFFDLLYCLWKLEHFGNEHQGLPKTEYVRCTRLLERHLHARFCANH
jgi:Ser/Thr protein kinase RdoA (MazF antagonist)